MPLFLGIDTSNYTTSAAVYDSDRDCIIQQKRLLLVKENARGLRQSDAVFLHIKQLAQVIDEVVKQTALPVAAVAASITPRRAESSYMPCFLVGRMAAEIVASTMNIPFISCSHQEGHIVAAAYSASMLSLLKNEFYAFHLSGGTTEGLLIKPEKELFSVELIAKTLDISAGQLIDRVGVKMGLEFPCGAAMDELALKSNAEYKINPSLKDCDCNLSGGENKISALLEKGESKENIAKFTFSYVLEAISQMTARVFDRYGEKPILYAGGVAASRYISQILKEKYSAFFASPAFSADNAAGVAIIAAIKSGAISF